MSKTKRPTESVLGKSVGFVIHNGGGHAPRRNTFRARPSVSRKNGREQCRHGMKDTENQKNNFTYLQDLHISPTLEETFSRRLSEITGNMPPREEPIEEKEKEDHARLPAQMPASRVSRNPSVNDRQERNGRSVRPRRRETSSRQIARTRH